MRKTIDLNTAEKLLSAPSGQRPRIYAERNDGQIVKLTSLQYLERDRATIIQCWTTGNDTTIADLIRQA